MAERLGRDLAVRGIVIVSGLARGIDAIAHQGALAVGGRAIGVSRYRNRRLLSKREQKSCTKKFWRMAPSSANFDGHASCARKFPYS